MTVRPAVVRLAFLGILLLTGPHVAGQLAPTPHPALPSKASDLWFVPSENDRAARTTSSYQSLVDGVNRYHQGDYAGALSLVARGTRATTALADYAAYYDGARVVAGAVNDWDRKLRQREVGEPPVRLHMQAGEAERAGVTKTGDIKLNQSAIVEIKLHQRL